MIAMQLKLKLAIPLFIALAYGPAQVWAVPILGTTLDDFVVLGASTVTNTGATTLSGLLGVHAGSSITGKASITINGQNADTLAGAVFVHEADGVAATAQSELSTAISNLSSLGAGTSLGVDLTGLRLGPGVYTVSAGVSNLKGTLTLDGLGNANSFWLFQMPSTLITSPGSVVNVVNAGAGAGVFWNVGSSATLDTSTTFQGNIFASASITLNTGATIGCGRALADTAAVTMDANTIGIGCTTFLAGGDTDITNGLGGSGLEFTGGEVIISAGQPGGGTVVSSPGAVIPEPGTLALLGFGLAGLLASRKRFGGMAY
jgi:hypothetical protein